MEESGFANSRDVRSGNSGRGRSKSWSRKVEAERKLSPDDQVKSTGRRGEDSSRPKFPPRSRNQPGHSPTRSPLPATRRHVQRPHRPSSPSVGAADLQPRRGSGATSPNFPNSAKRATSPSQEHSSEHLIDRTRPPKKRKSKASRHIGETDLNHRFRREPDTSRRDLGYPRDDDRGHPQRSQHRHDDQEYSRSTVAHEKQYDHSRYSDDYLPESSHRPSSRDRYHSSRTTPRPRRDIDSRPLNSRKDFDDHHHRRPDSSHTRESSVRRRSPSPEDLISALASSKRKPSVTAPTDPSFPPYSRRASRSPPPLSGRRDSRDWPESEHRRKRNSQDHQDYPDQPGRGKYLKGREEEDRMYGRGGPHRGGYYNHSQPPNYPNHGYYNQQHGYPPQGRGGYSQAPYGGHHGAPTQGYSPQGYHGYPQHGSPYHQQPHYQQQQSYQQYPRGPAAPADVPRAPQNRSAAGPPAGAQKMKGGHFANLSWTPGSKKSESNASVKSPSPAPAAPPSAADDDEEDNPFRPPKDFRAEDEAAKKREEDERKPISFTIKGAADKSAPPNAPKAPAVRMVKELVIRRRMKPRPEIDPDHVRSESVYYRKDGNESVVGSGTYGKVYKAIHVYTKHAVALKKIRMDGERDGFPVTAIREIKLLQSLHHPNIVALLETMVEKNDCFMIFEYLSHDLTGLLNHPTFDLTPSHKKDLARQLFEGLDYLHRRGVLHRDIKAANILVSNKGQLRLADFGLARFYAKNRKQDYTNRVITIWYRPPELLLGETQYGPAVDIWSAACVLVEIFTKHAIFPGNGEINQLEKIYNVLGTPSRAVWPAIAELQWHELLRPQQKLPSTFAEKYRDRVTPEAFGLLEAMFQFDPESRPTASDVLEHPYFTVEEPKPQRPSELEGLEGDWHEFESKALRKERDREKRKEEKEKRDREKEEAVAAKGEKRPVPAGGEEGEAKRTRVEEDV